MSVLSCLIDEFERVLILSGLTENQVYNIIKERSNSETYLNQFPSAYIQPKSEPIVVDFSTKSMKRFVILDIILRMSPNESDIFLIIDNIVKNLEISFNICENQCLVTIEDFKITYSDRLERNHIQATISLTCLTLYS